jgi:aspartate aminotransferase-like enzyme
MKPIVKRRVFTPGPTPLLPEAILPALVAPMHHRKGDFKALFREVQQGLGQVFKTRNEILLLGCSGSGAMEAAMTNLLAPGQKAVVAVAGKFGERWMELAEKFGVRAEVVKVPYGQSVTADQISATLSKDPEISAVFVQATETSTGARMDIERIGALVKRQENTLLVVDAITGLGTSPLHTDEWGLDIVIGGSQKAFMVPPGVAMMSVSAKAWKQIEKCARPRYYFDLVRERAGQREGQSAFTPSISIIQGLKVALDLILKEGVDSLVFNASLQAGATRAAITSWGMKIFPDCPSDATTAFVPPPGLSAAKVQSLMEERFGVLISGGQGNLKGKLLRIGHLGYFDFLETLGMIACLELSFVEAGAAIELGTGSRAAVEYYRQATGVSRP